MQHFTLLLNLSFLKIETIPFLIAILEDALKTKDKTYVGEKAEFPAYIIIESLHKLAVENANKLIVCPEFIYLLQKYFILS